VVLRDAPHGLSQMDEVVRQQVGVNHNRASLADDLRELGPV